MAKILVFAFSNLTPAGGLGDLAQIYESDNRESTVIVDSSGFLSPAILKEAVLRNKNPGRIQALHLTESGTPIRQEDWQRVSSKVRSSDESEVLVETSEFFSYLRVVAKGCVLAAAVSLSPV